MERIFKQTEIIAELDVLAVGQKINKKNLIIRLYGKFDFFISRSFDVVYCKAKKNLPEKKFKCNSGLITRIK